MKENILTIITPKTSVAYLNDNMTIRQGLEKLRAHGYSAVPVIKEDGTYYGVVSEGDFLWKLIDDNNFDTKSLEELKVNNIINRKVPACKIDTSIEDLISFVSEYNFVPIIDDRNILMGIITRKSIINYYKIKKIN